MIEVNGLVKKYGSHTAVDHLNFRIEKGHIYGLLGPNGAGKSTTMNIMTGYLGATEGEVLINGHDILKEPELAKKSVGYLPEMPTLYMDMKVQEYLMFAAELKKVKKADRIIPPTKSHRGRSASSERKMVKTTASRPYMGHRGRFKKPVLVNSRRVIREETVRTSHPPSE